MDELPPMIVPMPLGPGDDDPRSPARVLDARAVAPVVEAAADPVVVPGALGPADPDPRSPAQTVAPAVPALAPGASVGPDDDAFDVLAPPPPGPGDSVHGPRQLVRIPKRRRVAAQE